MAGKAIPRPEFGNGQGKSGFILAAVLWILAALAALASVYAVYIGNTALAARSYGYRVEVRAFVAAALELTAYRLIGFDDTSRPSSGAFTFRLGQSEAAVSFRSEGARIDLNAAPKALLSGLFAGLGAKLEDAEFYADRVVAWRTKPPSADRNPEAEAYSKAGLTYGPRQGPFQNAAELRLVQGLPEALVAAALPFVTIFNGRPEIDVNEAPPEVIAALPHMGPDTVADILRQRDPLNPQAVLGLLGEARSSVAVGGRKAVRVSVRFGLETGRKVSAEAVLLVAENGADPYRILAWRDDFDG